MDLRRASNFLLALCFVLYLSAGIAYASNDDDLRQMIGKMLIVGFRGTEVSENSYIVKAVNDLHLGGVILFDIDVPSKGFPRNITSPEQVKKLISDLRYLTRKDILTAVDVEGGRVNRLKSKYGFKDFPGAQELGSANEISATKRVGEEIAKELQGCGFDLNFAPVVDLNTNPKNPVIGGLGRSFSSDAIVVIDNAAAFIEGHRKYGVMTALKHFPGHGSSARDSHMGLTDVTETYNDKELIPYKELINSGYADIIMTAHVMNRKIDPDHPATLSKRFITGILRDELGFKGVVISDDMQMGAIVDNYGFEDAVVAAVNAGCDMLIIGNNASVYDESAPYRAVDAVHEAVVSGRISTERIKEANEHIKSLEKRKFVGYHSELRYAAVIYR